VSIHSDRKRQGSPIRCRRRRCHRTTTVYCITAPVRVHVRTEGRNQSPVILQKCMTHVSAARAGQSCTCCLAHCLDRRRCTPYLSATSSQGLNTYKSCSIVKGPSKKHNLVGHVHGRTGRKSRWTSRAKKKRAWPLRKSEAQTIGHDPVSYRRLFSDGPTREGGFWFRCGM
jgi:hypothetical protein